MTHLPEHIRGVTVHTRAGDMRHRFSYGVDYVLIDPEVNVALPWLFSRNRFNVTSVHDTDHGGPLKRGKGAAWARAVLSSSGLTQAKLLLLTQPRFMGYVFNPVSFWLAMQGPDLVAVIAEVSTPFGDRHSYLCHLPSFAPITRDTKIIKQKSLHVSPFQDVAGRYEFTFDITATRINICILHRNGTEGVTATLAGPRAPMTSLGIVSASLHRPLGALRTIGLIYWQALRLRLKGARYRPPPPPPKSEVT